MLSAKFTVPTSILALGVALSFGTAVHADEVKDTTSETAITAKAQHVIKGIDDKGVRVPTGQERIDYLKNLSFDATAVQNKVNELLGHNVQAPAVTVTEPAVAQVEAPVEAPVQAPVTNSDISVSDAANQLAARTGASAAQWQDVIDRESGGDPNAVNASSGAYGLLQLLGHGEYPGMSIQEQIDMAVDVYNAQGPSAWVAW